MVLSSSVASTAANPAASPPLTRARQLSPSSRGTPLILSEIMYHPREPGGTEILEYIEIFNTEPVAEDLSGYRLTGDVDFTFPANTALAGRSYVVVARDPAALRAASGIDHVIGPFTGELPNDSGQVRLRHRTGALLLAVNYEDQMPWPVAADGAGHSLQLSRPDHGERSVLAWSASTFRGGSPGRPDPEEMDPLGGVTINEFLAGADAIQEEFIELHNGSAQTVDLSGCGLSDRADTNRFVIPPGTQIAPGGRVVFTGTTLGFGLSRRGDAIFLVRSDGARVIDAVRFGAQARGVSSGRWPDGAPGIRALAQPTPGGANDLPRVDDVVIHEIMYHPISGRAEDEYVELYNRGREAVDVGYWRFVDGIEFMIPPGTVIPAGGYLAVARSRAHLIGRYPQLDARNTVGDYEGELSDRGERLALARPDDPARPFQDFVLVDEVTYSDGWGQWTDGGGSSLELIDAHADNALGPNWEGSDETAKAPWTHIEHTGVVDNPAGTMEELQVFCPQAGECLLDDIELKRAGEAANRVTNAGFESGLGGWERLGSHERSSLETAGGYQSSRSLHVRATSQGRYTISVYRITYDRLSTRIAPPVAGQTFTIRAKGRWIAGWPYIVIGVKGHALEAVGALEVPSNLGTPGQPNSRRVANAGPAIGDVQHTPVLPAAGQGVVVSARVQDPDGVASVQLVWRTDPGTGRQTVPMTDPDGDGVYRATLPGQTAGRLVAFALEATDAASSAVTSRFPGPPLTGAPALECLVRFGDTLAPGVFGTYRLWVASSNVTRWTGRETRSDEPVDATFTYDDYRTVYNATVGYRGNWRSFDDYRNAAYSVEFPQTQRVLGDNEVAIDFISLNGDNGTRQQEKHAYWMARQVDLASIALRYVHVSVNGSALFRYDSLSPSRTLCTSWYGDDDPHVYEQLYPHEPFGNYRTTGGVKKQAKYRYTMRKKVTNVPDDDYAALYRLVDALAAPTDDLYVARVSALADIRSWAGYWVINRMCGNGDHYTSPGYPHNLYTYIPPYGRSRLHANDTDGAFGTVFSLFPDAGYLPGIMFAKPEFRRVYWRLASDMVRGPMDPAVSGPRLLEWHRVFRDDGITATAPTAMSAWITARRNEFGRQLAAVTNVAFRVFRPPAATNATPLALQGRAPIAVTEIRVNGESHAVKWVDETTWQVRVALAPGANVLAFEARDPSGAVVGSDSLTVTYTGPAVALEGKLVLSEIMHHGATPASAFVEIHNLSATATLPLGGLRVDAIGAVIGHGQFVAPGGHVVLAESLPGYQSAYGNAEVVVGEFGGTLPREGGTLRLEQLEGTNRVVLDQVTYGVAPPWPAAADGRGASLQLMDPSRDNDRIGNWGAVDAGGTLPLATPGHPNNVATPLPDLPRVWINEIMPANTRVLADNAGEFDPWIELFNAGATAINLAECHLSNDPRNVRQWAFPAGWTIAPGERLLVWADAQPQQTSSTDLHAAFRLNRLQGTVVLAWQSQGRTFVLDAVSYVNLAADSSYGSFPEGDPQARQVFHEPTPALPNRLSPPPVLVRINEWMAGNTGVVADPADGDFDDWFELYNAGPNAVDLAGFTLTDNLDNPSKYTIPPGVILPAGGFLLVWADEEGSQNALGQDLHANFRLALAGEAIGLFAPDGSLVDSVVFGPQTNDVSEGRFPDGAGLPPYAMAAPTPRGPNVLAGANRPPTFDPLPDQTVAEDDLLTFTVRARDPDPDQTVRYELGPDAPPGAALDAHTGEFRWRPTEADGPAALSFLLRAVDNGSPVREGTVRVNVHVTEVNQAPTLLPIADHSLREGQTFAVQAVAFDVDLPPQNLAFALAAGAPSGMSVHPETGWLSWSVGPDAGPGTHDVTVRVTDDGPGARLAERSFRLVVEAQPHLVINEIMYRPRTNATEFIELFNNSSRAGVDLDGVQLTAGDLAFDFPAGMTLDPGGFLVVVQDRRAFEAVYGSGLAVAGEWTGRLGKEGDTVRLRRLGGIAPGELIDEVRFEADLPWPAAANGEGGSLQLIDAWQDNARVGNWAAVASLGLVESRPLLVMTNLWRYEQSGTDLGIAWREPGYDDSRWPSGRALLYVEGAALPFPKHTPLTLGPLTFYFRTTFRYEGPTSGVRLKVNTVVDDAAAIYLNGRELLRVGFGETGEITFDRPADRVVSDAALEGPMVVEGAALRSGTNVVAVEVHQNSPGSSDIVWGMDLEVEGVAAPATPGGANSLAQTLPPFPPVFLNELLAVNNAGPLDGAGEREPWIELVNASPFPTSLDGWYLTDILTDLTRWGFPAGFALEPMGYRLLWADGEPAETAGAEVHTGFRLGNGSVLALVRTQAGAPAVVDYVRLPMLGADTSYGSLPDGQGLIRAVLDRPTPGEPNRQVPVPVIVGLGLGAEAGLSFEWASVPGVRYRVEGAPALAGQAWLALGEAVALTDVMRYAEPLGAPMRYYRVVIP
ncbi:MAG: lamin tail domain-containing protein [Verrucomicrobiales bacterium]|nr:lamin tail domain-containing protein [Verrucomicrobiales bacterium]